jgi:hypothetical protein
MVGFYWWIIIKLNYERDKVSKVKKTNDNINFLYKVTLYEDKKTFGSNERF